MADLYKSLTLGTTDLVRLPAESNGDLWEVRQGQMGYVDVWTHHADGTKTQRKAVLADLSTLEGEKTETTEPELTSEALTWLARQGLDPMSVDREGLEVSEGDEVGSYLVKYMKVWPTQSGPPLKEPREIVTEDEPPAQWFED